MAYTKPVYNSFVPSRKKVFISYAHLRHDTLQLVGCLILPCILPSIHNIGSNLWLEILLRDLKSVRFCKGKTPLRSRVNRRVICQANVARNPHICYIRPRSDNIVDPIQNFHDEWVLKVFIFNSLHARQ